MQYHPECYSLKDRAERALGGGPATLSKHWGRYPYGIAPIFLTHGDGAYVWCPDGGKYIDCVSALGPIILGHAHPSVTLAVMEQARQISSASLMTRLEVEVAELLVDCIPVTEQARFARNGADVCNAAVKLARYVTGKQHVIFCGYHGGNDSYLATTDKHGGLLPQISPFNHQVTWNDDDRLLDVLDGCYKDLAAIIFEVPPEPQNRSTSDTMRTMQRFIELAHSNGALAIIDEVVTGFRYSLGGAQAYYGVQADVSCFSKALANGYPLAALCGPRDLMQSFDGGSVFLSTTFGGEATALAAAKATITTLQQPGTLARLREHGTTVLDALRDALTARRLPVRVRGNYARFVLDWQDVPDCASAAELRTLWLQELAKHGILASVPWFPMVAWDGTVTAQLITGIDRACTTIQAVVRGTCAIGDALECPTITDVFQQRYAPAQEPSP